MLKKGKQVEIICGKDKGKKGEIIEILKNNNKVKVKGINFIKKHEKTTKEKKGGIISKENFIHISNLKNLDNKSHMYFVHSYELIPKEKNVISSTTDYSTNIVCSVEKENIFGTQFHPEKSDKLGLKLIENFISI